jgi:hypothetical protein
MAKLRKKLQIEQIYLIMQPCPVKLLHTIIEMQLLPGEEG